MVTGQEQQAGELLSKAVYEEEVNGELEKAIEGYQTIVTEFPENKPVAAKAQYHLGLCYEKLGLKEAQKAYQKVLDNYPDQKQEIALAKERLNRLLALQGVRPRPSFRKIRIPNELAGVALSPDGQNLLLVSDKKLWMMPLSGKLGKDFPGKPVQLNTEGVEVEWTGLSWSGDGKWIAFNDILDILPWDSLKMQSMNQRIYVVPVEGGKPTKVIENFRGARTVNYKLSLSPRGKTLAFSSIENDKQHIQTISVEGGEPKQLTDMQAREPVISPDGKLIAFVEDKMLGIGGGGLWVIPTSGTSPILVAQAGKASSPVWSPDASKIAFLDYYEKTKIYIIPVDLEGKPSGEKITIDAPEEVLLLTGWSSNNKIGALIKSQPEPALYTLPEQGGQAALVSYGGFPAQPRWFPDGKQILFMKVANEENSLPPNHALAVVSADGGEDTNILTGSDDKIFIMPFQSGIRVSPDGKKIVLSAKSYDDTILINNFPISQIWTTNIEGKNLTQITEPPFPYHDACPCWSPDGKSIAFTRTELKDHRMNLYGKTGIYKINSSGGELKLLTSESNKLIISINWSPNGKFIGYLTMEKETPNNKTLNVINVENGTSRVVGEVPQVTVNIELAWSPDSRRIAFNDEEGKLIKVMSVDDGSIQDIETGLVDVDIYHLDWSPDGKRFVFAGWKAGDKEFWLMENFLSGSTAE